MKIKFIGQTDLASKGLKLKPGFTYEVSKEVYEYLKNTFGNVEALEVEQKVVVEEPIEPKQKTKVKVGTVVVPE